MRWFALVLLLVAGAFAGCKKESDVPPVADAPAQPAQPALPTHAQPKLKTIRLWLGPEELITELALTPIQEETGMMFRTNMPENTAMLFVFNRPMRASFWMKNCSIPLTAGYINPDGEIVEENDLQPQDTNAVVAAGPDVQFVLEVNQGWFTRHHIPVGTLIRTEYGSLQNTFFKRR
jgi:uncharacterized membrane protein (UPF0127 family)